MQQEFYIMYVMKTAYIFHDAFCDQYSDWYPWMKTTLLAMGYLVVVPNFPTPAGQSFESWKVVMRNYLHTFDEETILVGHGTGAVFALRLAEELLKQIHGLFLVAAYAEKIGHMGYDRVNETFVNHTFDWNKIKSHAMLIEMFTGADDPFVPMAASQKLADNLGIEITIIPDGGHINKASGFTQAVAVAQGISEGFAALNASINPIKTADVVDDIQKPVGTPSGIEFTEKEIETSAKASTAPGAMDVPNSKKKVPLPNKSDQKKSPEKTVPVGKAHTMYQDMTTLVNSNKGTVASSLLNKARTDEKIKEVNKPLSPNNILYIIGTIIIVLVALGVFALTANRSSQSVQPLAKAHVVSSLIQAEAHLRIDIANQPSYTLEQTLQKAFSTNVPSGTILDVYYTNGANRATFASVLTALGISDVPTSLVGEFSGPQFMHGIGNFGGTTSHFLVIPITDYDISFAGMQNWEPTMFRDLGIFMNVPSGFLKTQLYKNTFDDETISNQNIRVLRYQTPATVTLSDSTSDTSATPSTATSDASASPQAAPVFTTTPTSSPATSDSENPFVNIVSPYQSGDVMLAYFFLNEKTLIITDNTAIIPQILARYAGSQIYNQ